MFSAIVFIWILIKLQAPAWCFWLIGIGMFIRIADLFIKLGKAIGKSE